MGILFTIAAILAIIAIPVGIVELVAGKILFLLLCLLMIVVFGSICVTRFLNNNEEVEKLQKKIKDFKKNGYSKDEAEETNDALKTMKNNHLFEVITFPWWKLKKLKQLDEEKATKANAPKKVEKATEADPEHAKELEAKIAELEKKYKELDHPDEKPAETKAPVKESESKAEKPAEEKKPAQETTEPKAQSDKPSETKEPTKEPVKEPAKEPEKQTTEPAEKAAEQKPEEQSTDIVPIVYECEVITPPMTAYRKAKQTYHNIMAELGQI